MAVVYMAVVYVVLTVLAGYFLGCVNGALLVSKYILHDDVRDHGSGNAGLTNFHRVFGGKLTIVVVLGDMLKAVCAVLVGQLLMLDGQSLAFHEVQLGRHSGCAVCDQPAVTIQPSSGSHAGNP